MSEVNHTRIKVT